MEVLPDPPLKKLTDWFWPVHVINCAHRPDRLERLKAHIEETGVADWDKIIVSQAVIGDYTGHPAGWKAGNGAWGCLRSHMRVCEDLMHMRDTRGDIAWDAALILEDDVFFLDDALTRLAEFMPNIPPDWGQFYLGGQNRKAPQPTEYLGIMRCTSVNRTHAYAVSRQHIQKLYHHVSYYPDYMGRPTHIDHQLELAHQRSVDEKEKHLAWPTYCPVKWICGQEEGPSNISGRTNPRVTWQ